MYCTKCGKVLRQGDVYCSGCGQKIASGNTAAPAAKRNGGFVWLVILVAVILFINSRGGRTETHETETASPATTQPVVMENHSLPQEPFDGDVLEESDYPDGTPRRRISDYGDLYITDYRNDGTMLRESILYYSNGTYGGRRITNYDTYGNPTDSTQTTVDNSLWMYLYYDNQYDAQGRPLKLAEYNRVGQPLRIYVYTYNEDGSYRLDREEYRGAVYEYDFEGDTDGSTKLFTYGYTTFTAEGDVVDQMILDAET